LTYGVNSAIFSNTVTANVALNALGSANVSGNFQVDSGSANSNIFSDNLNVTSNTQIGGVVTLRGATTLQSIITVAGAAGFSSNVSVGGTLQANPSSPNTNIFSHTLNVTSNAEFKGANTDILSDGLYITANTTVDANVNFIGANTDILSDGLYVTGC